MTLENPQVSAFEKNIKNTPKPEVLLPKEKKEAIKKNTQVTDEAFKELTKEILHKDFRNTEKEFKKELLEKANKKQIAELILKNYSHIENGKHIWKTYGEIKKSPDYAMILEIALTKVNFPTPFDKTTSKNTEALVKQFQTAMEINIDGKAGPQTLTCLYYTLK